MMPSPNQTLLRIADLVFAEDACKEEKNSCIVKITAWCMYAHYKDAVERGQFVCMHVQGEVRSEITHIHWWHYIRQTTHQGSLELNCELSAQHKGSLSNACEPLRHDCSNGYFNEEWVMLLESDDEETLNAWLPLHKDIGMLVQSDNNYWWTMCFLIMHYLLRI